MTLLLWLLSAVIGLGFSLWFLADFCLGVVRGFEVNKILLLAAKLVLALLVLHFHFELDVL